MRTSEKSDVVIAAFIAAQSDIGVAAKNSTNPHFKSKYADLESINATLSEPLHANGLGLVQDATSVLNSEHAVVGVSITTRVFVADQWIETGPLVVPLDLNNRNQAQAMGSAETYARRYALSAMFNISTADDDGNGVVRLADKNPTLVTHKQVQQLQNDLSTVDGDVAKFCACMKVDALKDIKSSDFPAAVDRIAAKKRLLANAQIAKGGVNASA